MPRADLSRRGAQPPLDYPFRLNRNSMQARGLLVWWPTIGSRGTMTLRDYAGHRYHGTLFQSGGPLWAPHPEHGAILQYDGSDDSVSVTLPAEISTANPLSVSIWARRTSGTDLKGLFNVQTGTGATGQIMTAYYTSGFNGLFVGRKENSALGQMPGAAITQGNWNHFVITNAGGDVRPTIYVNGLLNSANADSYVLSFSTSVFEIGRGYSGFYAASQIGETRLYNRVLTPAEVWQMYDPVTRWELYEPLPKRHWVPAPPPPLIRIAGETVEVLETAQRRMGLRRILAETVQVAEGRSRSLGMTRRVAETVEVVETPLRRMALVRRLAETVEVVESVLRTRALVRRLAETVEVVESVLRTRALVRRLAESVEVQEAAARLRGMLRRIAETVEVVESKLAQRGLVRLLAESVEVVESTRAVRALRRLIAETVEVVEGGLRARGLVRRVAEMVEVLESRTALRGLIRLVTETVQIAESIVRKLFVPVALNVSRTLLEVRTRVKALAARTTRKDLDIE